MKIQVLLYAVCLCNVFTQNSGNSLNELENIQLASTNLDSNGGNDSENSLNELDQTTLNKLFPNLENNSNLRQLASTNPDSNGGGSVFYLDRHLIECPQNQVLSNFKFIYADTTMKYDFNCYNPGNVVSRTGYCTNKMNVSDEKNFFGTINVNLNCGSNSGIQAMKLFRDGNSVYWCVACSKFAVLGNCYEGEIVGSKFDFYEKYSTKMMNNMTAGASVVLQSVSLIGVDNLTSANFWYKYTSCYPKSTNW